MCPMTANQEGFPIPVRDRFEAILELKVIVAHSALCLGES